MLHELFVSRKQITKIRNTFSNNISTVIRLSKAQISKIIQLGPSFGSWFSNLGKKALTKIAIPLARDNLPELVSNLTSNAINKFERKVSGKGAVRAGKEFILFQMKFEISNFIKIIKLLQDSVVLIDGVSETVKHEIKKTRRRSSLNFGSTFNCFISTTSNFFSSKRYKLKRG